ncbi:helix-turn-helix domain-containing protein [Clostridium sp. WILCCON 0269]|uniref:Helix-turn-helix domain-containing protein n=1 Tax=Candidatus Clostridium eludens TaxID=3381663 RepID=A0ABW8SNG0_9CLOT
MNSKNTKSIGEQIKMLRKSAGFTQEQLAAKTNISLSAIGKYEVGERIPKYETLGKLATALGVTINELVESQQTTSELNCMDKAYKALANNLDFNYELYREKIGVSLDKMSNVLNIPKESLENVEKKKSSDEKLIVEYRIYLLEIYDLKEFMNREINELIFSDYSNIDILKLTNLTIFQRMDLIKNIASTIRDFL